MSRDDKIAIENFTSPGKIYRVDRDKYTAMRKALLAILPRSQPGLTVAEAQEKVVPKLPQDLFPGGEKSGWWFKAAQLDLEAKGIVKRNNTKPLRLRRTKDS